MGADGTRYLDDDKVDGNDPTVQFGEHAITGLKRIDGMPNLPGSGGHQPARSGDGRGRRIRGADRLSRRPGRAADGAVHPPSGRLAIDEPIVGAEDVYRQLRRWLSDMGIELGPPEKRAKAAPKTAKPPGESAKPAA